MMHNEVLHKVFSSCTIHTVFSVLYHTMHTTGIQGASHICRTVPGPLNGCGPALTKYRERNTQRLQNSQSISVTGLIKYISHRTVKLGPNREPQRDHT